MVTEVKVLAKDARGKVEPLNVNPGSKFAPKPGNSYKLVVDGSQQLPPGTNIFRQGNDLGDANSERFAGEPGGVEQHAARRHSAQVGRRGAKRRGLV